MQDIVFSDDICDHDAVIFVDQPGVRRQVPLHYALLTQPSQLHASDLRSLHPSSTLAKRLNTATSSVQSPYHRSSGVPFLDYAQSVSDRCNSRLVEIASGGNGEYSMKSGAKHVVCMAMESMHHASGSRMAHMSEQGNTSRKALILTLTIIE